MAKQSNRVARIKRRLTSNEEFEVMKLVLDKFLWIGTALMGWGLYQSIVGDSTSGLYFIVAGAVVLAIFSVIIVREFEQIR
jgi:hypothetical protein